MGFWPIRARAGSCYIIKADKPLGMLEKHSKNIFLPRGLSAYTESIETSGLFHTWVYQL